MIDVDEWVSECHAMQKCENVKCDRCRLTAGTTNLTGIAAHQEKRVGQRRNCGDDMSGGRGR